VSEGQALAVARGAAATLTASLAFDLADFEQSLFDRLRERLEVSAPEWLSVKGAASYLDMTSAAVRQLVRRGHLRGYRPKGGSLRLSRFEIDEWVRGEA